MFKKVLFFIILILLIIFITTKLKSNIEYFSSNSKIPDGLYAILSVGTGKYCTDRGSEEIICNKNNIGSWERFRIKNIEKDTFLIYGGYSNNQKLCKLNLKSSDGYSSYRVSCDSDSNTISNDLKWKIKSNQNGRGYNISSLLNENQKCTSGYDGLNCEKSLNSNFFAKRNQEFMLILLSKEGEKNTYCYDPEYLEFNPTACYNPYSKYSCLQSPKPGYKSSLIECKTRINDELSKNNYNNIDMFKLIWEAYEVSKNNMKDFKDFNKKKEKKCWTKLPNGCKNSLSETNTPKTWFIDPKGSENNCNQQRRTDFNKWCGVSDAEQTWDVNPPLDKKCWTKLPNGCKNGLSETNTPKTWFIDPRGLKYTCNQKRKDDFNKWCGVSDTEQKWDVNAPFKKCWTKLPNGCNKKLSETNTPKTWFIDPNGSENTCTNKRKDDFNKWCGVSDTEQVWGNNQPPNKFDFKEHINSKIYTNKPLQPLSYKSHVKNANQYVYKLLPLQMHYLKMMMVQLYKLGCMLKDIREDYFQTDECKNLMNINNINKTEWFSMVEDISKLCKDNKATESYKCEQFKKHLDILINLSNRIVHHNNELV